MLGIGGFTPLDGFMTKLDWQSVCDNMTTSNGTFWPIPITLSTDNEDIKEEDEVALVNSKSDEIIATMVVTEKYTIDKEYECDMVYKTTEMEHPGVVMVMEQSKYNLSGPIKVLSDGDYPEKYGALYMTPTLRLVIVLMIKAGQLLQHFKLVTRCICLMNIWLIRHLKLATV